MSCPHDVLTFWFGDPALRAATTAAHRRRWFGGGPDFDDEIRQRFAETVSQAIGGQLGWWTRSVEGKLALIVVLDQFPRNIYRGTAQAFSGDAQARALSVALHAAGEDAELGLDQRLFASLPFLHAESLALQRQGVVVAARMLLSSVSAQQAHAQQLLRYAMQHHDIIERFGRFPHRNRALGRQHTAEEAAWLAAQGETFGQESGAA